MKMQNKCNNILEWNPGADGQGSNFLPPSKFILFISICVSWKFQIFEEFLISEPQNSFQLKTLKFEILRENSI